MRVDMHQRPVNYKTAARSFCKQTCFSRFYFLGPQTELQSGFAPVGLPSTLVLSLVTLNSFAVELIPVTVPPSPFLPLLCLFAVLGCLIHVAFSMAVWGGPFSLCFVSAISPGGAVDPR